MKRIVPFLFLLMALAAKGQYNYSPLCVDAHANITMLRFDDARILIEKEKMADPENLIPLLLENYIDFLTIILGEDERVFDRLEENRNLRLKMLENGDRQSPWYRFSLAQVNLQWAFARVKFGERISSARDIRRAYLLLSENNELFPGFLPDKIGLGIMHALIGTIPDNYQWIASLFSMEGSVEQGRNELMYVLNNANAEGYPYLTAEALFFISFIDLNLQPDRDKARDLLPYYSDLSDSNLMFIYAKSRIYMQTGLNDEAIELLVSRPHGKEYFPFFYLDYLTGLAKMNRLDQDAEKYFFRFTTNFEGMNYVKSAYQKLAWCALLKDDMEKYHDYMERVELYGDDLTDGDKHALAEARSGIMPNLCLLQARLLYDGGYYDMANSILDHMNCILETERDKTEFPYRKGRICHARGMLTKAMEWYNITIELGKDQPYYFAANAALQAGTIYEMQGKLDLAEAHYKKSLGMKNKEYKNSITQKAKAGLNRIQDKRKIME
jgi:tetratricopeptide (TPR) repeat protein